MKRSFHDNRIFFSRTMLVEIEPNFQWEIQSNFTISALLIDGFLTLFNTGQVFKIEL